MNHLVWIVFDSCRYDSWQNATTPNLHKLGAVEKRYSYASWTSPSHFVYMMGLMPHKSPKRVIASEVYLQEFKEWERRLGVQGMAFRSFVPQLCLAKRLSDLGWRCSARVSLPVLNPAAGLARGFDDYQLMEDHFDFRGMVEQIDFPEDRPAYWFLNVGETHYPYMLGKDELPRVSGVHGVLKHMEDGGAGMGNDELFDTEKLKRLHRQQSKCVEYLDGEFARLYEKAPEGTWFIVTADHGELFGEEGYFGHGPIFHEKVFEVPFVEGQKKKGAGNGY